MLTLLRAAKERELLSVVRLVDMALQHYPAMFVKDGCVMLLKLLRLLWPLFASGGLRCAAGPARAAHEQKMLRERRPSARRGAETAPRRSVHGALADAVASLATLLARANRGAFRGLVSGVFDLLLGAQGCGAPSAKLRRTQAMRLQRFLCQLVSTAIRSLPCVLLPSRLLVVSLAARCAVRCIERGRAADLYQLLGCFGAPGCLPPGASAELACFPAAYPAAAPPQAAGPPPGAAAASPRGAPGDLPAGVVVRLAGAEHCELLAAAGLALLQTCLDEAPGTVAALAAPGAHAALAGLATWPAPGLPAAALACLERLVAGGACASGAAHAAVDAALGALGGWAAGGARCAGGGAGLPPKLAAAVRLLRAGMAALAEAGGAALAVAAPRLAAGVAAAAAAAAAAPGGGAAAAELCALFGEAAAACPAAALPLLPALLPAAAADLDAAGALVPALRALAAALPAEAHARAASCASASTPVRRRFASLTLLRPAVAGLHVCDVCGYAPRSPRPTRVPAAGARARGGPRAKAASPERRRPRALRDAPARSRPPARRRQSSR